MNEQTYKAFLADPLFRAVIYATNKDEMMKAKEILISIRGFEAENNLMKLASYLLNRRS